MAKISNETKLVLELANEKMKKYLDEQQAVHGNDLAGFAKVKKGVDKYSRVLNDIVTDLKK